MIEILAISGSPVEGSSTDILLTAMMKRVASEFGTGEALSLIHI